MVAAGTWKLFQRATPATSAGGVKEQEAAPSTAVREKSKELLQQLEEKERDKRGNAGFDHLDFMDGVSHSWAQVSWDLETCGKLWSHIVEC